MVIDLINDTTQQIVDELAKTKNSDAQPYTSIILPPDSGLDDDHPITINRKNAYQLKATHSLISEKLQEMTAQFKKSNIYDILKHNVRVRSPSSSLCVMLPVLSLCVHVVT